ncbi:hypothetical protein [Streptomyces sp. NPDC060031]|uniref:hypothetical protein n=1 Tax=Streptomyces sp. NPDC060031 TaxID=3347043 RepID=UPI0036A6C386
MSRKQDKRPESGKGREEPGPRQQPGQDPVHPESGMRARGKSPEEIRREGDPPAGDRGRRDDAR